MRQCIFLWYCIMISFLWHDFIRRNIHHSTTVYNALLKSAVIFFFLPLHYLIWILARYVLNLIPWHRLAVKARLNAPYQKEQAQVEKLKKHLKSEELAAIMLNVTDRLVEHGKQSFKCGFRTDLVEVGKSYWNS